MAVTFSFLLQLLLGFQVSDALLKFADGGIALLAAGAARAAVAIGIDSRRSLGAGHETDQ